MSRSRRIIPLPKYTDKMSLERMKEGWMKGEQFTAAENMSHKSIRLKRNVMARVPNIFKTLLSEQISVYKTLL